MEENELQQRIVSARRVYQREWRARNKDKVRLYNQRFWEKQAIKLSETDIKNRKENCNAEPNSADENH